MTQLGQMGRSQAKFLKHFRKQGNVSAACRYSAFPKSTLYRWLSTAEPNDEVRSFQEQFRDAEVEAVEHLEDQAYRRAMGYKVVKVKHEILRDRRGNAILDPDTGKPKMIETERTETTEYSPTILMRLLAARAPDKYRDRSDVQHSGPGGGAIPITLIDEIVAAAEGRTPPQPTRALAVGR